MSETSVPTPQERRVRSFWYRGAPWVKPVRELFERVRALEEAVADLQDEARRSR